MGAEGQSRDTERKVIPIEEGRRRRELREKDERLAHAEFAEFVRESQGDEHRTVRVNQDETVLCMRLPSEGRVFCFAESDRLFLLEGGVTRELPHENHVIAETIAIATPGLDVEVPKGTVLSKDDLAEVSGTFQQAMDRGAGPRNQGAV